MSAVLFGSISTVADTSELQRAAFNQAFAVHGLDWSWDGELYRSMLSVSGGRDRIAGFARQKGHAVDAAAIHQTKSTIFRQSLAGSVVEARTGVVDTIRVAKRAGAKVAFVTTTSAENVSALLGALSPAVSAADFDVIVDASVVDTPKPDRAAYDRALQLLGEAAEDCLAIEDNVSGVQAATAAGVRCVAFPNTNTATHHFPTAQRRVTALDPADIVAGLPG